jgi:hypothetical protein
MKIFNLSALNAGLQMEFIIKTEINKFRILTDYNFEIINSDKNLKNIFDSLSFVNEEPNDNRIIFI